MKDFLPLDFDLAHCRQEVEELRALLESRADLGERNDLLPFFKARPQLLALIGQYCPNMVRCNRLAWEYDLFGDCRCDFLVGDAANDAYTLIECEDASPSSIFTSANRAAKDWSPRFEHGYSQIIDWFHKIATLTGTEDMEARFGKRSIRYTGVLLIGRSQYLSPGERLRLEWRRAHVVVNSKYIHCLTYDELLEDLTARLRAYP